MTSSFISVPVPRHLIGTSVLANEQLPTSDTLPSDPTSTLRYVPAAPTDRVHKSASLKEMRLSQVLYDENFLADIGLGTAEANDVRELANSSAATAAAYLSQMCALCSVNVVVVASEFGRCTARSRTTLKGLASHDAFAVAAIVDVVVHDERAYVQCDVAGDAAVLHSVYWKWPDLHVCTTALAAAEGADIDDVLSHSSRVGVDNYYGPLQRAELMEVEDDDRVPEPTPTRDEKSVRDYYDYHARHAPRIFGGAYDFQFEDSEPLRGATVNDLQSSDIPYHAVRAALGERCETLLGEFMSLVRHKGAVVGHRVTASAKDFVPRHLFNRSHDGLFSSDSPNVGLYVSPPTKGRDHYACFYRRGRLLCTRLRILKELDGRFYFRSDRQLVPGTSGAVIVDSSCRAVGVVERVVSYHSGLYEALTLDASFQDVASEYLDYAGAVYDSGDACVVLDSECGFARYGDPREGDLILTANGICAYSLHGPVDVKLSAPDDARALDDFSDRLSAFRLAGAQVASDVETPGRGVVAGDSTDPPAYVAERSFTGPRLADRSLPEELARSPDTVYVDREALSATVPCVPSVPSDDADAIVQVPWTGLEYVADIRRQYMRHFERTSCERSSRNHDHNLNAADLERMRSRDLTQFYDRLGYRPVDMHLYFSMALTHTSYCAGRQTNEGLAMLGDSLLRTLAITRMVWHCHKASGSQDWLSSRQSNTNFAAIMRRRGLDKFLLLGGGLGQVSNARHLGTAYEALFAVLFMENPKAALSFAGEVI
jgi:hypothetical protein